MAFVIYLSKPDDIVMKKKEGKGTVKGVSKNTWREGNILRYEVEKGTKEKESHHGSCPCRRECRICGREPKGGRCLNVG